MSSPSTVSPHSQSTAPEIRAAVSKCRTALMGAGLFSGLINMLALSSSIYMLQVYDRVIPSHSVQTLIGLSIAMLLLFVAYGFLDIIRTRIMSRIGIVIDRQLRERVLSLVLMLPLRAGPNVDGLQPVRDLDQIRSFMASAGPVALFDLPWLPLYLALVWLLHPWLGILATLGALMLVGITVMTELRGREPTRDMAASGARRLALAEASRRNAAAIRSMGMSANTISRWSSANERYLADQTTATDVIGTFGSVSKVLRLVLQSAVLGLGAYLVIQGQATAGVMIAASILVSRALAPIEIAIANWRGFIGVRQSVERLSRLLAAEPQRQPPLDLPKPADRLDVDGLWVAPPGQQQAVVQNTTFSLVKGDGLGIIGPSASGKSTLARALIGAWVAGRGSVRLDGAAIEQWSPDALGRHIGYLPQELELFDGTVAENISRFDPDARAEAIIDAARQAGVHDLIVHLPKGYDTRLGEAGQALSAGQRQRVALARALYGNPFLVVLDEPNSNLDRDGDDALDVAIKSIRARGGIVIVIAHRPSVLAGVDKLLVLQSGQPALFGPKDEVMRKLTSAPGTPPGATPGATARPAPAAGAPQQHAPSAARSQPTPTPFSVAAGNGKRLLIVTDEN